jgi:hypothetical protein
MSIGSDDPKEKVDGLVRRRRLSGTDLGRPTTSTLYTPLSSTLSGVCLATLPLLVRVRQYIMFRHGARP